MYMFHSFYSLLLQNYMLGLWPIIFDLKNVFDVCYLLLSDLFLVYLLWESARYIYPAFNSSHGYFKFRNCLVDIFTIKVKKLKSFYLFTKDKTFIFRNKGTLFTVMRAFPMSTQNAHNGCTYKWTFEVNSSPCSWVAVPSLPYRQHHHCDFAPKPSCTTLWARLLQAAS